MVDQPTLADTSLDVEPGSIDRRRRGRIEYHGAELIGLLRQDQPAAAQIDKRHNDLGAFTGLMTAACFSLLLWTIVGLAIWVAIRNLGGFF